MGAPALAFSVPDATSEQLLRLVASYSGCPTPIDIKIVHGSRTVEFSTAHGENIQGLTTACICIVSASPVATQLLGSTPEQEAKVIEWLTFATTELSPLLDDKLAKINDWLVSRTLLVGNVITLADLVLYAVVHPATSSFPIAQHIHFLQLLRWYDYVHAVADPSNIFPAASFEKPRLVRPLPSLPASTASIAPPSTPPPPPLSNDANKEKKRNKGDDTAPVSVATASNKETKIKEKKKSNDTATTSTEPTVDVLDIRIGIITKVGPHPGADGLYVEDIDVGEDHPRQVVSGLRKFVALEHMEHRRVVVVCNLKPAKMREVMSCGMVLCASNEDHTVVDPITPPQGAAVGERVQFEGFSAQPEAQLNPKKKIFERIAPFLVTSADGLCTYKGVPFMTSAGPVTATLPNAHIA